MIPDYRLCDLCGRKFYIAPDFHSSQVVVLETSEDSPGRDCCHKCFKTGLYIAYEQLEPELKERICKLVMKWIDSYLAITEPPDDTPSS